MLAFFLVLAACTTTRPVLSTGDADHHLIKDVPFYPDAALQCGPACLAGVLNYWGVSASRKDVADAIYSRSAGGTLAIDLVWYARSKGLRARQADGTYEDVCAEIDRKHPVIVLVDMGFSAMPVDHFMVVVGFTRDGVIVNSGKEGQKRISRRKFERIWSKTRKWTLLITPES